MNDPEFVAAYLQVAFEEEGVEGLQYVVERIFRVQNNAMSAQEANSQNILDRMKKLGFKIQVVKDNAEVDKSVGIKWTLIIAKAKGNLNDPKTLGRRHTG